VDGARGSSFLVEATGEVTGMTLEVSARPSTAARFLDDGTGSTVSPTLDNAGLESPRGFERVDAAEPPPAADSTEVAGGVGSSEIAA